MRRPGAVPLLVFASEGELARLLSGMMVLWTYEAAVITMFMLHSILPFGTLFPFGLDPPCIRGALANPLPPVAAPL